MIKSQNQSPGDPIPSLYVAVTTDNDADTNNTIYKIN